MRRLMRLLGLAEYGADEVFIAVLACGVTAYALTALLDAWLAVLPLAVLGVVLYFFRDPERLTPQSAGIFVAPADGTVQDVGEVNEPEFIGGRALRIGIFLSPLNVHVNRSPGDGVARFLVYKAGEFLPAYNPQAPLCNESVALGMETPEGFRILVKQISGVLARRIVCEAQNGDSLRKGQRYGMIKFGSRTELYVPLSAGPRALVAVGDKVQGGLTEFCGFQVVKTEGNG